MRTSLRLINAEKILRLRHDSSVRLRLSAVDAGSGGQMYIARNKKERRGAPEERDVSSNIGLLRRPSP